MDFRFFKQIMAAELVPFLSPMLSEVNLALLSLLGTTKEENKFLDLFGSSLQGKLRKVSIRSRAQHRHHERSDPLITFFQRQPNLESIKISSTALTKEVANSFAGIRNLRSIVLLANFLHSTARTQFLDALATSCPALEVMDLSPSLRQTEWDPEVRPLDHSTIQPLLNLHRLLDVQLAFPLELLSDPGTILAMGRAWYRLETLRLSIPISLLRSIATAFQATLRRLQVNLVFDPEDILAPANVNTETLPHLHYLEVLHSNLPPGRVTEVGGFLAVCCPQAMVIRNLDAPNWGGSFVAGSPWALVIEMMNARREEQGNDFQSRN